MTHTELTLGFSPCPNDTLIFFGLVHGRIPTDLSFRPVLADVEQLNTQALGRSLDVTKISYHAFCHLREHYYLLRSGGALGRGCGPLLVARTPGSASRFKGKRIAIPGRMTTAFLLLQLFDPALAEGVIEMPFDQIMPAVARGEVNAGLIIHESRFTYPLFNLHLQLDLGDWWEKTTGFPIPLGAIVGLRSLGAERASVLERLVRESVIYGRGHYDEARPYVMNHAQEMDEDVLKQHIGLYVNDFSVDLGDEGTRAVRELIRRCAEIGVGTGLDPELFAGPP